MLNSLKTSRFKVARQACNMSIKDGVKKRFFNRVIEVSTSCTVRIAFEDIRLFKTAEF